jgi:hypothetical protein
MYSVIAAILRRSLPGVESAAVRRRQPPACANKSEAIGSDKRRS